MSVEPPIYGNAGEELRELWQDQQLEGGRMPIEELRKKAGSFEKNIRRRNLIEYSAAVIVLVSFSFQVFTGENALIRAGAGLTVLATLFVVYSLHTRGSARNMPDELGRAASLDFHRASLERQRDLLLDIGRWYLLPFVPGVVVTLIGFAVRDGVILNPTPTAVPVWQGLGILTLAVVFVAFYFFVAGWNKRIARKLQSEIDALEE